MDTQTSQPVLTAPPAVGQHGHPLPPHHHRQRLGTPQPQQELTQYPPPPTHQQQQREQPEHQRQPWSFISALSISLYQSLSFSRSPSFERTRYIASTCTFIAIIYLRTLHCLFFGTGALSCAVLGKYHTASFILCSLCFSLSLQSILSN